MAIQVEAILTSLSRKRPCFHSEADFQFALAWEIQTTYRDAEVRLEINVAQREQHERLDVLIQQDRTITAIELKYKTCRLTAKCGGEEFQLRNHGAQDIGRYDFIKDIVRLEHLLKEGRCHRAYAIFGTNDPGYWKIQKNLETNYAQFSLSQGRVATGTLQWGPKTGSGTMKGREAALVLEGRYVMAWKEYSVIDSSEPGPFTQFRYLALPVEMGARTLHLGSVLQCE